MTQRESVPVHRTDAPRRDLSWFPSFEGLRKDMEDMVNSYFGGTGLADTLSGGDMPVRDLARLDVSEADDTIHVEVDLPGSDPKDVEVVLSNGTLIIKGERSDKREDKGRDYHRVERRYGSFSRRIALPCEVEDDQVTATFAKGVLTVSLPKSQAAKQHERKIEVKAA